VELIDIMKRMVMVKQNQYSGCVFSRSVVYVEITKFGLFCVFI